MERVAEQLQGLEARIQATARSLSPKAPAAAIESARRQIRLEKLANLMVRRSKLPLETMGAPEPIRIKARWLSNSILDLAHELEPKDSRVAIDLAKRLYHLRHPASASEPGVEAARQRFDRIALRMGRDATFRRASAHQRVRQVLGDLGRLEIYEQRFRDASESRHKLAFQGNVVELRAALEQVELPNQVIDKIASEIYPHTDLAREAIRRHTFDYGIYSTIERLKDNPELFGTVRGKNIPGLGPTPARALANQHLEWAAGYASKVARQRDLLESNLSSANACRDVQSETREMIRAYPSRDSMLTELGRQMERLSTPVLSDYRQNEFVNGVAFANSQFLEPLRSLARDFHAGAAPSSAKAQAITRLFQAAPKHVLRRLTPSQMHAIFIATSLAKRTTKAVVKAATA